MATEAADDVAFGQRCAGGCKGIAKENVAIDVLQHQIPKPPSNIVSAGHGGGDANRMGPGC